MTALYSPRWYRVAGLKPKLLAHAGVRRQHLRGERWYLLADPVGGRSVRLNAAGYAVAARLDGKHTVQQLWDRAMAQAADSVTQDEVIELLARLREAALVQFDRSADFDLLLPHLENVTRRGGKGHLLAWRVRLADPSALLERLSWLQPILFSRTVFAAWLLAVALLAMLALQHAPTLWDHAQRWMATPRFALLALGLYVPIKLLHEMAHALAVRRWGGQVREAGVTLMLLMPVPYVDASAASSFVLRRQRIAVSAAGIMLELALAALALPLWLWLDDGLLRDAAFVTLTIAGVSTLLFNANPLQRLDGYFILTDALDLPNLGARSRNWWSDRLMRSLLRVPGIESMPIARGESPWLALYAPLAWLYSLIVTALAVAWLGQLSLPLGLAAGALLAWQVGLRPVLRLLQQLRRAALAQHGTARRWRRLALGGTAALALALLLPLPQRTLVQGVVWPPERAQLRGDEDGFVEALLVREGQAVEAGERVMQLSNPVLQSRLERQAAKVSSLETLLFQTLPTEGASTADARAGDARAELVAAQAEWGRLKERVDALALRAHAAGHVAWLQAADLPGRYVHRGSLLGEVLTDAPPMVRVALPEAESTDPRRRQQGVSVRLAATPQTLRGASLARDSVGAVMLLPSAALSTRHGGEVQTDARDPDDLKPLRPVVLVDVRLDAAIGAGAERVGERAWVRFDTGWAPLALQLVQAVQRQVAHRFNPQI